MNLLQLNYFRVVARVENISLAAKELHISQPSLSSTIKRLEDDLGVPLFKRRGRGIQLNQFGEIFLKRVEHAIDILETGKKEIIDLSGLSHGIIKVGSTTSRQLSNLFKSYLANYPNTKLQLAQIATVKIENSLELGVIDLCICTHLIKNPQIESKKLTTEEIFIAISPNHPLANIDNIKLSDLANEKFVSLSKETGIRKITDEICDHVGFSPDIVFESNSMDVIISFVKDELGVAFLPAYSWDDNNNTTIKKLHIADHPFTRTIWLAWHKERYTSLATQNFKTFIVDFYSNINNEVQ